MVKKIVDDHHAAVRVESELGSPALRSLSLFSHSEAIMTRILIVDDDEKQRLLYREQFEDDGYEVVEVSAGGKPWSTSPSAPPTR